VFLIACANKMERAQQALDEISYSVTTTLADGTKYVRDEATHVQQELADLQSSSGKNNYAAVLLRASLVLTDAKSLAVDAAAKTIQVAKTLDKQWSVLVRRRCCSSDAIDRAGGRRSTVIGGLLLLGLALAGAVVMRHAQAASVPRTGSAAPDGTGTPTSSPSRAATLATHITTDREIALNAALERELALTSERLQYRKRELRWMVSIIALTGVVLALLTWMLVTNVRHRRELLMLAEQDGLTGLPNRRRTAEKATAALAAAALGHRPLTLALIDLDHFKRINDRCGHAVGDHVLKEFARLSRGALRAADTLGRWGGEEFLLVLPDTQIDSAVAIIRRMQSALVDVQLPEAVRDLSVSFSAGLVTRTTHTQSLEEVIACADVALYEAKNGGRNLLRIDRETRRAAKSAVLQALGETIR
jgi:diguanylate cyclase (GGDEF)-like protein